MSLPVPEAERILRKRYGEPAKEPTKKIIGFKTPSGRVLALHNEAAETRVWFQPPKPPKLDGVIVLSGPTNRNSNINGPFLPLKAKDTQRVEIEDADALRRFLDWYDTVKA